MKSNLRKILDSTAIASKVVLYEEKKVLTEGEKEELDKKIAVLHSLTAYSRLAREHNVSVTVTHFVLCADQNHEACGKLGRYEKTSGIVQKIDPMTKAVTLDRMTISAEDIIDIDGEIFAEKCEEGC